MGCLKLTYNENNDTLKVAYSLCKENQKYCTGSYRYQFNGKQFDEETETSDFGARNLDEDLGVWGTVDPLAHKLPGFSPYSAMANNPIMFIDEDGRFPYTFHVRSFIPTARDGGGMYRGDHRGFSLSTANEVRSRLNQAITIDPDRGAITNKRVWSDPSMVYATPWTNGGIERTATPEYSYSPLLKEKGSANQSIFSISSNASASDPLAFGIAPDIDYKSTFAVTEDLKAGKVFISAVISGENYPATESFVKDAGGNGIFIGARTASGSILGDYGKNDNSLINVDLQLNIDKKGNFTGVVHKGTSYSITDWNKQFEKKPTK